MIKLCQHCGREFEAQRSTARYCCDNCRVRAFRTRAGSLYDGENAPAPVRADILQIEQVAQLVQNAHSAAEDLSRASRMTAAPLCSKLERAAYGMEQSLRGEGL